MSTYCRRLSTAWVCPSRARDNTRFHSAPRVAFMYLIMVYLACLSRADCQSSCYNSNTDTCVYGTFRSVSPSTPYIKTMTCSAGQTVVVSSYTICTTDTTAFSGQSVFYPQTFVSGSTTAYFPDLGQGSLGDRYYCFSIPYDAPTGESSVYTKITCANAYYSCPMCVDIQGYCRSSTPAPSTSPPTFSNPISNNPPTNYYPIGSDTPYSGPVSSPSATGTISSGGRTSSSASSIGVYVGAAVGGVVVIGGIAAGGIFFFQKAKKNRTKGNVQAASQTMTTMASSPPQDSSLPQNVNGESYNGSGTSQQYPPQSAQGYYPQGAQENYPQGAQGYYPPQQGFYPDGGYNPYAGTYPPQSGYPAHQEAPAQSNWTPNQGPQ
jgi:hypothetical protein